MKSIIFGLILAIAMLGCNASSDKKADSDSTPTYHEVGVKNVNGGIPDTTNAIDLTHKLDTISNHRKDSTK
ncbi:MAG: hypothetical protein M3139_13405 [Bacteroidota bacterium]|nr:hypothetical protein [Bacteroidota bacterium]